MAELPVFAKRLPSSLKLHLDKPPRSAKGRNSKNKREILALKKEDF
jgi:hypothetical protein